MYLEKLKLVHKYERYDTKSILIVGRVAASFLILISRKQKTNNFPLIILQYIIKAI